MDFSMLYLCGEYGHECRASVVVVMCIFCTAPCGSFGALMMLPQLVDQQKKRIRRQ